MAVGKHLMCCFFYSLSVTLSLSLFLFLSQRNFNLSFTLFLSLSLKSCAFSYQKKKEKAVHFICSFVSLHSPTFKSTTTTPSPPSKYHQTERDPLKFQLPNPHFKPHNTALITFKLHFSLFSNSHNTGFAIGAG